MLDRVVRAVRIRALAHAVAGLLVAGPVAGCTTSVEGNPSALSGERGSGDATGDEGGAPAGGGGCGGDSCDVYQQCGCEPGQACDLDGADLDSGATVCRAVTSPGQTESNCNVAEDCAAGYSCLGYPGQCRKMCDEDSDCGSGRCVVQVIFQNDQHQYQDVPNARACTKPCAAESPAESGCPRDPAMGCRVYTDDPDGAADSGDEYDYTDCTPAGSGGDGFDCSTGDDADCAPGYGCYVISYDDGTAGTECRRFCVVSAAGVAEQDGCGELACTPFSTPSLVGDIEYGLCL
jgi:hypothetical protein